jgi:hypothetical protein
MYQRTSVRRAAGAAVTAAAITGALALTAGGAASAAATAAFLEPRQLPPHSSSQWTAGPVVTGLPEYEVFCLDGALPDRGVSFREYWTEYDTWAVQFVVTSPSESAARTVAATVEKAVRGCAGAYLRENPRGRADWEDYGRIDVEEGAHVYGVHTAHPDSEHGVSLFGVGRDGTTVTVVKWAETGTLAQAPVAAFGKTTATAVDLLYG